MYRSSPRRIKPNRHMRTHSRNDLAMNKSKPLSPVLQMNLPQSQFPSRTTRDLSFPARAALLMSARCSVASTSGAPVGDRIRRKWVHRSVGGGGLEGLLSCSRQPDKRLRGYDEMIIRVRSPISARSCSSATTMPMWYFPILLQVYRQPKIIRRRCDMCSAVV